LTVKPVPLLLLLLLLCPAHRYPATPHFSDAYYTESSTLQRYQPTGEEATALAAAAPAYGDGGYWGPCMGKCIDGGCALKHDHPTCCVAQKAGNAASSAAVAVSDETASTTSSTSKGRWYGYDLYCWK
jgi:hypothetical protein